MERAELAELAVAAPPKELAERTHLPAPGGLGESYAVFASADNTRRAYGSDLELFWQWCSDHSIPQTLPVDAGLVSEFLYAMADGGMAVASIDRALTSVAKAHVLSGHSNPRDDVRVREALRRIRRARGSAQDQKAALSLADLRIVLAQVGGVGPKPLLERALLLTAWWGALRRSEAAALRIEDVDFRPEGVVLTIRRSKTDQNAVGASIGLPKARDPAVCPVLALRAWMDLLGAKDGMLFRSVVRGVVGRSIDREGKFVARTAKRYAKAAGIDPSRIAGHSLRSGFVTEAIRQHRDPAVIRKTTRHSSDKMLAKYIRERDVFDLNAANGMA